MKIKNGDYKEKLLYLSLLMGSYREYNIKATDYEIEERFNNLYERSTIDLKWLWNLEKVNRDE